MITPSASITVAGTVSFTQTFPAGTLASGVNYYLAFYDSTQASPTWQTISGPVTTSDGVTLTFSGTVGSVHAAAGCRVRLLRLLRERNVDATAVEQAQETAYLAQGTAGIVIVNTSGAVVNTLNINSNSVALDDSANLYNDYSGHPGAVSDDASAHDSEICRWFNDGQRNLRFSSTRRPTGNL